MFKIDVRASALIRFIYNYSKRIFFAIRQLCGVFHRWMNTQTMRPDKQADIIDDFNTTSRYLDDISNINNVYFNTMVSQIYPSELQLNKTNTSDTEAAFLDLHLSISNDIVSTKNL